jgi:hypothetical protein
MTTLSIRVWRTSGAAEHGRFETYKATAARGPFRRGDLHSGASIQRSPIIRVSSACVRLVRHDGEWPYTLDLPRSMSMRWPAVRVDCAARQSAGDRDL